MRFLDMRVVNGRPLADRLLAAAKDESSEQPLAAYARRFAKSDDLQRVYNILHERSVRVADVEDTAAVATVHPAKGFRMRSLRSPR